ncbi:type II secretion system protein [Massilia sp. TN1-12]|uniref:type II secretion system protein n=1 Tax=Massilia paldalensis TaxID=3377675 RepID=UPI00384CC088
MRSGKKRVVREAGFTYLGLIVTLAIIGLVGAATLKVEALLRRAAAEQELLETGAAFSAALKSYADATPRGQPTQPPSLKDLLKDPRFPGVRRHLRKMFVDPVTGKAEWGIVWANPGNETGVLAVYSLSQAQPLKQANFDARFANLEGKEHLSEWKFAALGQTIAQPGQQGQQPGQQAGQQPGQPSLFPAPAPAAGQAAPGQGSLFPAPQPAPAQPAAPEPAAPVDEGAPAEGKDNAAVPAPADAKDGSKEDGREDGREGANESEEKDGKDIRATGRR